MRIYKIALTIAAIAALPAAGQSTKRLSATKANEYGIVYSLPNTMVDVTLEAEITVRKPGEFYKYAKKYLNVDNPITEESSSARLKSVTVSTRGVANMDERYLVTLKSGFAPYMELTADNVPLSINVEGVQQETVELPVAKVAGPTPLETGAARQVITEEMLQSHSSAKRAELAAAQIYALRQSRTDLITGQAEQMPPDGKAMELIMKNIDDQEAALTAMFVGTESVSTQVETIGFYPTGDVTDNVIARVSGVDGIVDATDLSGVPVYVDVTVVAKGEMPVNEKGEALAMPKNGVAYCIPGTAEVKVEYDGRKMADKTVKLAQLGVVYGMSPNSFTDKKAPMYVRFDQATGAIIESGQASRSAD